MVGFMEYITKKQMRKHRIKLLCLIVGLGILAACSKESGEDIAKQQTSIVSYLTSSRLAFEQIGDVYKVVKEKGYGYEADYGDTVTFNYTIYEYNKSIVLSSNVLDTLVKYGFDTEIYKPGPTKVVLGEENFLAGIREGLLALHADEVCDIYLTSNLGYGDKQRGPVAGNTMLRIRMQILAVNGAKIIAEKEQLAMYIAAQGITAPPQTQGYYFTQTLAGVDSTADDGDTTFVSYVCKSLSGTVIEEIAVSDSLIFKVGSGKAPIVGLDLALHFMKKGASATIILPSCLAYGKAGKKGLVQPYETLVFDVNLITITKK